MSIVNVIAADLSRGLKSDLRSAWQKAGARFSAPRMVSAEQLKQRAKQRLCMARLRAEQRGQSLDGFPERQRNRKAA